MHKYFRNINDAFRGLVTEFAKDSFDRGLIEIESRVGSCLQYPTPVIVTYQNPLERVLFNESRDCNCFFHLMEAMWMLSGRNDLAPLQYYVSTFGEFSDDKQTLNGAYGRRWRRGFIGLKWDRWEQQENKLHDDQIRMLIEHLRKTPNSRRAVLQMWNTQDDLSNINISADVCCNLSCCFLINNGKLDMTVFNRSNDLIWGCLGANQVHFSFLLEYMAAQIGVNVGVYNQVTNNLHIYTERFASNLWLSDTTPDYYTQLPRMNVVKLVNDPVQFDKELEIFNRDWLGQDLGGKLHLEGKLVFKEPFFATVAYPMAIAFFQHKKRQYEVALNWASNIMDDAWRRVAVTWLKRRQALYNRAKDDGVNPMLQNELERQETGSQHSGGKDAGTIS